MLGGPRPIGAILCHGMLSDKDSPKYQQLAEQLSARNIPTLRFDFSGRGESGGSLFDMTYSKQIEDLNAAIEYLAASGCTRVALFGSSMGGTVAILVASRDERVVAIATMAAVAHTETMAERYPSQVEHWRQQGYIQTESGRIGSGFIDDAETHDVIAAAGTLLAPLHVVHGEEDEVVPSSDAHDLASAARNASLCLVPDADHRFSDPKHLAPEIERIAEFFVEVLEG